MKVDNFELIKSHIHSSDNEEEFYMLSSLFDNVCHQLHGILSLSYKFLVSTGDINLEN